MERCSRIRKGGVWLSLVLLGLALAACEKRTTANVVVGQVTEGEAGESLQKDVLINDKALSKEIEVLDVKARHIGDFLEGQAVIRNLRKNTVEFEYRFEWFDQDGFPLESNVTLWKPELVYGKETKWIKAVCPKPDAKGFKILIREPNPTEEQ